MYRKGDHEVVVALDRKSGRTVWEYSYAAPILTGMDAGNGPGPHSTPLVVGGRVYAIGATAKFHCLSSANGKVIWSHELWAQFKGTFIDTGYSSSPIAYQNMVIVPVGGPEQALVALRQSDGAIVWKRHSFASSPSSPLLISVGGQDQLVAFMAKEVLGVDPRNGDLLWSHSHVTRWDLNISTPVWAPNGLLFLSSAYGVGSRVLELTRFGNTTKVKELWANPRVRVHKDNAILIGEYIYASSGDFGPAFLTAVKVTTGEIAWQDRSFAKSSLLYADGKLIVLDEDGNLALAVPSAEGLRVLTKAAVLQGNAWTVPTLAGTTLYVRDRKKIVAIQLGSSSS
jgi:outer membrane protein assembly factor BamB